MKNLLGFTLLEALITLLILAILGSITLPGFKNLSDKTRLDHSMKKVLGAIQLAKATAINRSTTVTICRSLDGLACGGQWQDGIIVFTDSNKDRVINQQDTLVRYIVFDSFFGEIRWRAFQNRQYLQINSRGITRYQNGNFTFCPQHSGDVKAGQLIINRMARVRYAVDTDGDGFSEDSRGRAIRC